LYGAALRALRAIRAAGRVTMAKVGSVLTRPRGRHIGLVAAVLAATAAAGASCSSTTNGTGSQSESAVCTTPAASQLATDGTGQALAQAYRQHAPTTAEMQYAAAFLVLLASSVQRGTLDATLFETDIIPQLAYLASSYPALFQPCTLTPSVGGSGSAPASLKPRGVDCSMSCLPSTDEIAQLGAKAAGWAALASFAGQAAGLAGLDETMREAVGALVSKGGATSAAVGGAAIEPIPLDTDIQLLEQFGTLVDAAGAAAAAGVLLGISTAAASTALGTLATVILADQLALGLLDAWGSYQSCQASLERGCTNPPPLNVCDLSNGTVGHCDQPSHSLLCVDPLDPKSCSIPRAGGGNPIEDAGCTLACGDGGTGDDGGPGDGSPADDSPADAPAPEVFVSTTYNAPMSAVSDSIGCQYSVSASGQVTFNVVENNGVVTGTAVTPAQIDVQVTFTPPNDTCTGNPFTANMSGNLSGNDASLNASLATSGGAGSFVFTGTRSGSTITGSATISYTLQDGSGAMHPSSGTTGTITATKQ
jgi:hypothetical protein